MTFEELGLSPEIVTAITKIGFVEPTPVQAQVIPRLLENKGDLVALAQTGTGKTAAFGLPILNMLRHDDRSPQALILCPTRELCVQITRDLQSFASGMPKISIVAVYGGAPIVTQLRELERGVQIIVATPGRMLDILRRKKAPMSGIERVILDEADEMLNMGFQEDLEAILAEVPDGAHSLLFSATMPRHVAAIANKHMKNPEEITIGHRNAGAETVSHEVYVVHQRDRYRALKRIADFYPDMYGIVFCRTRQETQSVADWLIRDGYNVDSLHGDLSQAQRDSVMKKFRARTLQFLVATDVAARGLDVTDLTHVINYNLPDELGNYTHRSGRTGRAGKRGVSVLLVNMHEKSKARRIEGLIRTQFTYREVPTGREICEAQLFSMIERMKSVEVDHKQIDQYLPKIFDSLKGMSFEDVVKHFVSLEFNTLLNYYRGEQDLSQGETLSRPHSAAVRGRDSRPARKERSDRPERGPRPERSDRPERGPRPERSDRPERAPDNQRPEREPAGMRMFVNLGTQDGLEPGKLAGWISRVGGQDVRIGRIEILKKYSYFDVPHSEVAALTRLLGAAKFSGRNVRVEPVDPDAEAPRVTRAERRAEQFKDRPHQPAASPKPNPSASSRSHKSGMKPKRKSPNFEL